MRPLSLNTVTVRDRWSLADCIEGCARHGIPAISPWRDKLAELGTANAARQIRDAGLAVSGLCRGGMFHGADWRDDNRRAIEEAQAIGAACLVMVVGGLPDGSKDIVGARKHVGEALAALLPEARAAGVTLALEPLHPMTCADRSVLSTLAQALDLCDALGEGTGVAVDVYHVWWDPDLARQIARAAGRIAAFHICDWLVPTIDLVFDRGLMGDGVIDIAAIQAMVEAAGYTGHAECEILSKRWWSADPNDMLQLIKARHAQI